MCYQWLRGIFFDKHHGKWQKKSISQLPPGFIGAMKHKLIGNLMPCPTGFTAISCNETVPEFEGNKIRKTLLVTLVQVPMSNCCYINITYDGKAGPGESA